MVLDEAGLLKSCRIQGHAGSGDRGNDIVCAAVSVLARTIIRVLSNRKDLIIRGTIPEQGDFRFETEYSPGGREFLSAAGTFLIEGLTSVSEEFPDNCRLIVERRNSNGT